MKLIHCADLHLGSNLRSKYPKELAEERAREVCATFSRLADYAEEEGVRAVLLSGDVFDSDRPFKKDKNFFFDVVRAHPNVDFFYLRGNHDALGESETLDNLKTFEKTWTSYALGNVCISGVELTDENAQSVYASLSLKKENVNIVMMHGNLASSASKNDIWLSKLREKNIDYLALGHIHSYKTERIDERGVWAYSGCLEGRGLDETGKKGFVLLEIGNALSYRFMPFCSREIVACDVDITGAETEYDVIKKVKENITLSPKDIYLISLLGTVDGERGDLSSRLAEMLMSRKEVRFAEVKDKTEKKIDFSVYENDKTLRGEFVRKIVSSDLSEEDKRKVILLGLRALDGKGVE